MEAVTAIVALILGLVLGGGCAWVLYRHAIAAAREQERCAALANVRVAEERVVGKDAVISDLNARISNYDRSLQQRDVEITRLKEQSAILVTEVKKEREKVEEKIALLSTAEQQLKTTFTALAADALQHNNKEFEKIAKPVQDTLKDIDLKIAVVNQSATDLGGETRKLVKALQKPEVRGQWGELHLLRVVEMCGMTERCDFDQQQVIGDGECVKRPDLIIHLPGERHLVVDAKAPVRSFLDSAEEVDENARRLKLQEFVAHVREHVRSLGSKAYFQSMDCTPEFVVMYLPTEAIYCAAMQLDCDLMEYAVKNRVHLASPMTLISLLRSAAYDWKQDEIGKHAKEIHLLGEELYKRVSQFGSHMCKLGTSLKRSVDSYNQAVGSLELRVLPQARKLEQRGAAAADAQIEELAQIEVVPRDLQSPEFSLLRVNEDKSDEVNARPR